MEAAVGFDRTQLDSWRNALFALREAKGLERRHIAASLASSQGYVRGVEDGHTGLSRRKLLEWGAALRADADEIDSVLSLKGLARLSDAERRDVTARLLETEPVISRPTRATQHPLSDEIAIYRVEDPEDQLFRMARKLYEESLPPEMRDDYEMLGDWIGESKSRRARRFQEEVLLVAATDKDVYGLIHGTVYKQRNVRGRRIQVHRAFVSTLCVGPRRRSYADPVTSPDATRGPAATLARRLAKAFYAKMREADSECWDVFFEIAHPSIHEDAGRRHDQALWIAYASREFGALQFQADGLQYRSGDTSGDRDEDKEYPMLLMRSRVKDGVADRREESIPKSRFIRDILGFVYGHVYAESIGLEEQDVRGHLAYVGGLRRRVAAAIQDDVVKLARPDWRGLLRETDFMDQVAST